MNESLHEKGIENLILITKYELFVRLNQKELLTVSTAASKKLVLIR